jgi:hypothetical protein
VIVGLRPFRDKVVELGEGRLLTDSNKDFKRDMEMDHGSNDKFDGGLDNLDEEVAKSSKQESVEVEEKSN